MIVTPPETPIGGFLEGIANKNLGSQLRAAWLTYVAAQLPNALDAINGGYYQFVSDIELSSDTKQIKINAPAIGQPTKLLGYTTIGLSDDVNYTVGTGALTVSIPATFSNTLALAKGLTVNQSTVDGTAIQAFGNGIGRGIEATGGSTNATGGYFLGGTSNGHGLTSTGSGTGTGATIAGGGGGVGLAVSAGGGNTNGIEAYSTGTGYALACKAGGIRFEGTAPVSTADPGANAAHGLSFSKAWAHITTDGAGNGTVVDGKNIQSISVLAAGITITFARAISAGYCPTPSNLDGTSKNVVIDYALSSTTLLYVKIFDAAGGVVNPVTTIVRVSVDVKGRQ